jgi:2-iminobutanoate/2-iminopropanoate deaminase
MSRTLQIPGLFSEPQLFSLAVQAGEFTFVAQDARGADGTVGGARTAAEQARQTVTNIELALKSAGQSLANLVNLSVFIADYADAQAVASILRSTFTADGPAINFVGVCGLDGACRLRMDALATTNNDRETILISDLPLSKGARCHGVRVGDLVFLSGVDAADAHGRTAAPTTIQAQTTEVLTRIGRILGEQNLALGNLCRTFMFMPGTQYRPGYGDARRAVYRGVFAEDRFPPNSGIYICSLGENILLRSMAIACRGKQTIVTSPKVRLAPGSFSQSARAGDWLLLAGQDAVTFERAVECEGSLAGQTEATLRHTKDIVEAAGGTVDDIVKTTVYLIEGTDRAEFAEAYGKFFAAHGRSGALPAGLTVEVKELAPGCLVEIDSVAWLG